MKPTNSNSIVAPFSISCASLVQNVVLVISIQDGKRNDFKTGWSILWSLAINWTILQPVPHKKEPFTDLEHEDTCKSLILLGVQEECFLVKC